MTDTAAWHPAVRPEAVWTAVEDQAVVVLPDAAKAEVVNETGARVLALADGSRGVDEIVGVIVTEFDVTAGTAREDIMAFLGELVRLGILHPPEAAV